MGHCSPGSVCSEQRLHQDAAATGADRQHANCRYRAVAAEDAGGRWAPFRLRPYDRICAQWLILHKVDNNDQMR